MGLYTVEMRFGGDMDVETDGQGVTGQWLTDQSGGRVIYEMFNTVVVVLLGGMHVAWR